MIAELLHIAQSTIHDHLKKLGFVNKLKVWVPYELKEIHLVKLLGICHYLLKREEYEPFLKRVIIGDEKNFVHFELLPKNQTIDSVTYCQQLDRLNYVIEQNRSSLVNRKGVVFHHDNTRPHTSLIKLQKLLVFLWDVLPSVLPDLTLPDYYLFRPLENSLNCKTFDSDETTNWHLVQLFASKDWSWNFEPC